ncbi:hypothetical protein BpHYR1_029389 [Brachionus plicatilis]|uniref:Uncharacterized protein n=1 Tax=Brachionus plicatilis TaxID=10195 RepID=A0A3M7Q4J0_BRAPC|nr:hypothetical protein BpHYR1_029389 [Brachionus plicatilis]
MVMNGSRFMLIKTNLQDLDGLKDQSIKRINLKVEINFKVGIFIEHYGIIFKFTEGAFISPFGIEFRLFVSIFNNINFVNFECMGQLFIEQNKLFLEELTIFFLNNFQ